MEHTWGACTVDLYRSRTAVHVSRRRKAVRGQASPGRVIRSGRDGQVGQQSLGRERLPRSGSSSTPINRPLVQAPLDTLSSFGSPSSRASRPPYPFASRSLSAAPSAPTLNTGKVRCPTQIAKISAQDYDDAVEATPTDASSANTTGTADEVGSHDGWVGEDGPRRGKSPRIVVAQYPPATREALLAELPPRPATMGPISVPHSLELSSSQPSASSGEELVPLNSDDYPAATRALKNAVVKISAEAYEYWVFRSPESVAAADLEPPDYSQPEKYVPKNMTVSSTAAPTAETVKQGMVLERSFAPVPTGPKKPRPKRVRQEPHPRRTFKSPNSTADLRRWKEKAIGQEVVEIPPPKKQKRPIARGSTPVLDALREGGEHTASFIDKVRAVIPTREAIRDLDTDQVGEMIAQSVLWLSHMTNDLFCRAKAAKNVAHAKGRYEMQQAVREALEVSLDERDFATVMSVMPDPVPAPGPMPYTDPAPGDDAPALAKERRSSRPCRSLMVFSTPSGIGSAQAYGRLGLIDLANPWFIGAYGRRRSSRPQVELDLPRPMSGRVLSTFDA
nr:uncharacterized protein LOC109184184 [Ipomoea batatas]